MKELTVLATQNDPFRIDTPARHRDGEWLALTARELGLGDRKIHLRGLHYMVLGRPKPDGQPYTNTEEDWTWLAEDAGKAARWLGYLDFDQIIDNRNTAPMVTVWTPPQPWPYISVGVEVEIPDADDFVPRVGVSGFQGVQPYKLVIFGEKSSLEDVLGPLAQHYAADLYLPTGEISDTLLYQMAKVGGEDGRPMVVLCFCDADPSGWQMPISIARKLQAFKVLLFPDLAFQVQRVALTPEQVGVYGLPSTPLKETEQRADGWRTAMGVEQTEIDALASLQPDLLRQLAREAIGRFYDTSLDDRVAVAHEEWLVRAAAIVGAGLEWDQVEQLRTEAAEKLASLRDEIDALNDALRIDASDFDLPEIVVPDAQLDDDDGDGLPLVDSRWSFAEQCRRLIDSKAYRTAGPEVG
ncbi:MAG: hypothetical protein JF924_00970 [Candidatus Dormibacteraeota bacterium]|nr:hypothetical protein [Candidatus Dormibacteraeota bacterium]